MVTYRRLRGDTSCVKFSILVFVESVGKSASNKKVSYVIIKYIYMIISDRLSYEQIQNRYDKGVLDMIEIVNTDPHWF